MAYTTHKKVFSASALARRLRQRGGRVVFTNGVYDLIHAGHVTLLEKARALGDCLVLGLNSDKSVKRIKGPKRPICPQADRAKVLSALSAIDYIVFFDEDTPYELIKKLRPTILVKGGDYKPGEIIGRDLVKKVVLIPFVKGRSTTGTIEKIVKAYGKK